MTAIGSAQLTFRLEPVIDIVTGNFAAYDVEFVCTFADFLM
ncbi:hypothetical protein [Bosea sp. AS-1]|nr:hypothetical protein [Bosea sp. AS-1]